MAPLQLNWIKTKANTWARLGTIDLSQPHFDDLSGVYVIWQPGDAPNVVRVGQGNIRERLTAHKTDVTITSHGRPFLYVTWARVEEFDMDGVEVYLAQQLKPKEGDRFPDAQPIAVNLPA